MHLFHTCSRWWMKAVLVPWSSLPGVFRGSLVRFRTGRLIHYRPEISGVIMSQSPPDLSWTPGQSPNHVWAKSKRLQTPVSHSHTCNPGGKRKLSLAPLSGKLEYFIGLLWLLNLIISVKHIWLRASFVRSKCSVGVSFSPFSSLGTLWVKKRSRLCLRSVENYRTFR